MGTDSNKKAYNPTLVSTCLDGVNSGYNQLATALGTTMQNTVVNPVAAGWATPQAKTYWGKEQTAWNDMCKSIYEIFSKIVDNINTCANNYARAAEASWSSKGFSGKLASISTANVKDNAGGEIGIVNQASFDAGVAALTNVQSSADAALEAVVRACANSGFIDASTEAAIAVKIAAIRAKIAEAVSTARNGITTDSGTVNTNYANTQSTNTSNWS